MFHRSILALTLSLTFAFSVNAQDKKPNPIVMLSTSHGDVYLELFQDEAPETVANFIGLAEGTKEFTDPKTNKKTKRPYFGGLVFHRVIKGFMIQGGCPLGTGTGDPGYKFKDEINADSLGLNKKLALTNGQPHPWLLVRSQQQFQQTILMPLFRSLNIKSQADLDAKKAEVQKKMQTLTLAEAYSNMGYKYDSKLKSRPPTRGVIAMANSGPNTNGSQFFINLVDTPHLTGKHTVFGRVIKGMGNVDKIGGVKVGAGSKPVAAVTIKSVRTSKEKIELPKEPKTRKVSARDLTIDVPKEWTQEETTSQMRLAQFAIPAVKGDSENAELVVYFFGAAGGGSVNANLKRWVGQFADDGREQKVTMSKCPQGEYHLIELSGTYNKPVGPPINRKTKATPGSRMLGVIISTDGGQYFLKLTGPDKTVAAQSGAIRSAIGASADGEKPYKI